MDFTLKKIQEKDVSIIVEIDAFYSGDSKPKYWQDRLEPFLKCNPPDSMIGYVALMENQVIGYILAEARAWEFGSPLCGWIFAIGVKENFTRKGVALFLCKKVCLEFKSMGICNIRTMVKKDDVRVLSFFRSSGFIAGPFMELELNL